MGLLYVIAFCIFVHSRWGNDGNDKLSYYSYSIMAQGYASTQEDDFGMPTAGSCPLAFDRIYKWLDPR